MRFSPQTKMNAEKVVLITLGFLVASWFQLWYNQAIINGMFCQGPSDIDDMGMHIVAHSILGLAGGLFIGTALVTVNGTYFRKKSFGFALLTTACAYILTFIILISTVPKLMVYIESKGTHSWDEIIKLAAERTNDPMMKVGFVLWGGFTLLALFLLQVNDKFGPGILRKFLMGRYHTPKEEDRIFMFLDMQSSTTIAEELGNQKYFNLINDAFHDITSLIIEHEGEIYQYVGDEIVISWALKKGKRKANCLQCFFGIKKLLESRKEHYIQQYGLIPKFKAGIHHGTVTAGEIGSVKRDIVYSGDVLNTAARIQGLCNERGVNLLISNETFELLDKTDRFSGTGLGEIELRGKAGLIELSAVVEEI